MTLKTYGMVAASAVVTAGAVSALASPASAHDPSIDGLAGVGRSRVLHYGLYGYGHHNVVEVCNFDYVHTNRGEFKLSSGETYKFTNTDLGPNCGQYLAADPHTIDHDTVAWFRHCDPWGCTEWKTV
jgi:hypothetical protein